MAIFASRTARMMHKDPAPWVLPNGDRVASFGDVPEKGHASYDPRWIHIPATSDPANPILVAYRPGHTPGGTDEAVEWLFQLARHWALWQSPRIGTFPLDYRDPSGPASPEVSQETGEDWAYYEIESVIEHFRNRTADTTKNYAAIVARENRTQDIIVHAVKVLGRLVDILEDEK